MAQEDSTLQELQVIIQGTEKTALLLKGAAIPVLKLLQYLLQLVRQKIITTKQYHDFKSFLKNTDGEYSLFNVPSENQEVLNEFKSLLKDAKVNFCEMPDLNAGDGFTQFAVSNKDRGKFQNLFDNFISNQLNGGKKTFTELKTLTNGQCTIKNVAYKDKEALQMLYKQMDKMDINYAILTDLNPDDDKIQIAIANFDMDRFAVALENYRDEVLKNTESANPAEGSDIEVEDISEEDYVKSAEMTEQQYENAADPRVKDAIKKKATEKKPEASAAEKSLNEYQKKTEMKRNPVQRYESLKKDTNYTEVTITKGLVTPLGNEALLMKIPNSDDLLTIENGRYFAVDNGNTYVAFIEKSAKYGLFQAGENGELAFKATKPGSDIIRSFAPVKRDYSKSIKEAGDKLKTQTKKTQQQRTAAKTPGAKSVSKMTAPAAKK